MDYFALEIRNFQVCIIVSSSSLSGCDGVLEYLVAKKYGVEMFLISYLGILSMRLEQLIPWYIWIKI